MTYAKSGLPMTAKGIGRVCEMLEVGEAEIWAVLTVETRGFGYLLDRRPRILFERHIFSRRTDRKHDAEHPDISSRRAGGYLGEAREYDRLKKAAKLDEEEALKSASWGLPQVMGFNHRVVGFGTVEAMVESKDSQLQALGQLVMAAIHLQRADGFFRGTALEATANEPPGFGRWDDMAGLLRLLTEG